VLTGIFSPYLGYVLVGGVLYRLKPFNGAFLGGAVLFLVATGGIMAGSTLLASATGHASEVFYEYLTPLVAAASVGLFLAVTAMPVREGPVLRFLANSTMGIYILQLAGIRFAAGYGFNALAGNAWVSVPVTTAVVVMGCLVVTSALRLTRLGRLIL
jgi:surface polysaccharide O-acyltransferase-like enzyme